VHLHQPVADEQRGGDAGLDRLLVPPADDQPIDDGVHPGNVFGLELDLFRDIDRRAVDDHRAAALLPHFGEDELEILSVDLEDRRAQLDFGAFRQRKDGFQDLARRPARRHLAGSRAVRLADGGK